MQENEEIKQTETTPEVENSNASDSVEIIDREDLKKEILKDFKSDLVTDVMESVKTSIKEVAETVFKDVAADMIKQELKKKIVVGNFKDSPKGENKSNTIKEIKTPF